MHWFWRLLGYTSPKISTENEKKPHDPLSQIRNEMRQHKIGIYIVLMQDEHRSEYVPDADRRVRYISNFTGSAGSLSIGLNWAELATDSRYYLIAQRQLSPGFALRKSGLPGVEPWDDALITKAIEFRCDVGVDPRFIDSGLAQKISSALKVHGLRLKAIKPNLVDKVWESDTTETRPQLPSTPITELGLDHTGKKASEKVRDLREDMLDRGTDIYVSYSLEDTAWLLNLRGGDVPYVPIFKSFLIVTPSKVVFYVDKSKLSPTILRSHKREGVSLVIKDYTEFFSDLAQGSVATVWVPNQGSWAISLALKKSKVVSDMSPVNLRKAVKNCAEIVGLREAQLKCSLSIVRYFAWLGEHIDEGINEYEGGLQLLKIREELPDFMGNSFETISAAGPNASAPHYAPASSGSAIIERDQIYLLDSGSQFLQGSTDITRTTHYGVPTSEEVRAYTLVLKGQLAVSSCVFPEGTSGYKLDILARQFLWEEGMDYGHGTGHGIGSFLNIHELPLGIGMSSGPESILEPGHFVSDEPGYYADGQFGIRLESDILVVKALDSGARKYHKFEIMTLVPYEPKLIDVTKLTGKEKTIINDYHEKCRSYLMPYLKQDYEREWLSRCTQKL